MLDDVLRLPSVIGLVGFLVSLFVVLGVAKLKPTPGRIFALSVCVGIASVFLLSSFLFCTALGLLAASLLVLSSDDPSGKTQRRIVVLSSFAGLVISVAMRGHETLERVRARERFQYVSIRERVSPVNPEVYRVQTLSSSEEAESEDGFRDFMASRRARSIEWLHKSAVAHFLETPDFGVMRMGYPSLYELREQDGKPIELPQEPYPVEDEYRANEPRFALSKHSAEHDLLVESHQDYRSWFVEPSRFGSIQDLDHVAGFESHGMFKRDGWSRFDDPQEPLQWGQRYGVDASTTSFRVELKQLQLVGLLYHSQPVVYELDTLPELLSAETADTRLLDEFEKRGLARLLDGEMIHVEHDGNRLRMLGSLRNAKSCVECHEGPTNQLLGAFSYHLEIKAGVPAGSEPIEAGPVTMNGWQRPKLVIAD